jgi:hypothetical protein
MDRCIGFHLIRIEHRWRESQRNLLGGRNINGFIINFTEAISRITQITITRFVSVK